MTHDRPISEHPILRWLIAGSVLALFLVPLALSAFDAISNSDVDSPARTSTSYVPSYSSRYGESSGLIDAEERAEEAYDRAAEAAERADEAARLAAEMEHRLRWLEYDQQQLELERDFEQITGCYVAC